jgi:hypothetical protein
LRSAFDHLAWQLSSAKFQAKFPHQVEFPVFQRKPFTRDELSRYRRKIEGISSPTALARIDSLQPYHQVDPSRYPLWLIHDLDRTDKHRELVLAVYIMKLNISADVSFEAFGQQLPWESKPRNVRVLGEPVVDMKGNMSAQVTFKEFSGRDDEHLIPMLKKLLDFTVNAIESFAGKFM